MSFSPTKLNYTHLLLCSCFFLTISCDHFSYLHMQIFFILCDGYIASTYGCYLFKHLTFDRYLGYLFFSLIYIYGTCEHPLANLKRHSEEQIFKSEIIQPRNMCFKIFDQSFTVPLKFTFPLLLTLNITYVFGFCQCGRQMVMSHFGQFAFPLLVTEVAHFCLFYQPFVFPLLGMICLKHLIA